MTDHQNAAAGLEDTDGVKLFGCTDREVRQAYPCQNHQQDSEW
jgi:hypothetical protein